MPKTVLFFIGILCIPLLILAGCANGSQSELQTLFVGPIQVECEGVSPQLCLLVKSNPTDHFELFYDQIIGFEYEPGFTYELQVTEETIDDPPADSPSIRLILEEVIEEVEASSPLEGSFWDLQSYRDEDGTLQEVIPQVQTNIKFNTLEIGGSSGCNTFFGSYTVDGEWIFVGVLASTEIFCDEPEGVMEQERSYLSAINNAQTYQINGDELQMINSEGDILLTYNRVEATPLVGTDWVLTGYNNGMGGFVSLIGGTHVNALFGEDGILSGSGGCNSYNAAYQVSDNQIRIEAPISTSMFCGSPEGTMVQENAYLSALETSSTYEIQGNQLIILAENGELALAFISDQVP